MLKSILCDYRDENILRKGTETVTPLPRPAANPNNNDKKVVSKSCAPFTDCISKTNNTEIDIAKDIDVVMLMYNLVKYANMYSKASGSLWQYYRDEPILDANGDIANFPAANSKNAMFIFKQKITGKTIAGGTVDVGIMVLFKHLDNF